MAEVRQSGGDATRRGWHIASYVRYPPHGIPEFFYVACTLVFGGTAFWFFGLGLYASYDPGGPMGAEIARNYFLIVASIVAGPFLVWRTITAYQQSETARETHLTTLFTRAVEQLGAVGGEIVRKSESRDPRQPNIETKTFLPALALRIGAIHIFERVAQDSPRTIRPILESLAVYVRSRCDEIRSRNGETYTQTNDDKSRSSNGRSDTQMHDLEAFPLDLLVALRGIEKLWPKAVSLEGVAAAGADRHARFRDIDYLSRQLTRLEFSKIKLHRLDFSGMTLDNLLFRNANIEAVDFTNFGSERVEFVNVVAVTAAGFDGLPLPGAKFEKAEMKGATFAASTFKKAEFVEADLRRMEAQDSQFDEAKFVYASLILAKTNHCDFNSATLFGADLVEFKAENDCSFRSVNFLVTNLSEAEFGDSDLTGARFRDARIDGAILTRAKGLRPEQIDEAWGDDKTQLPPGLQRPVNTRWHCEGDDRMDWDKRWHDARDAWINLAR